MVRDKSIKLRENTCLKNGELLNTKMNNLKYNKN